MQKYYQKRIKLSDAMIEILINNIIPFMVILTILVFVHELGHYSIARYNDVKVEVFFYRFWKRSFWLY